MKDPDGPRQEAGCRRRSSAMNNLGGLGQEESMCWC